MDEESIKGVALWILPWALPLDPAGASPLDPTRAAALDLLGSFFLSGAPPLHPAGGLRPAGPPFGGARCHQKTEGPEDLAKNRQWSRLTLSNIAIDSVATRTAAKKHESKTWMDTMRDTVRADRRTTRQTKNPKHGRGGNSGND